MISGTSAIEWVMSFLKGLKRGGNRSVMIRLANKAMDDPVKVLKKIDPITRSLGSDDRVVRTMGVYILYRMAREDLNEEVRHYVGDMADHLGRIEDADRYDPVRIRCPSCMKATEVDPPVFPKMIKCTECGKPGRVMIPVHGEVGSGLSELYWTVSFLFQMARMGHLEGMEAARDHLDSLKDHPVANIRKRSRMTSIMISEGRRS